MNSKTLDTSLTLIFDYESDGNYLIKYVFLHLADREIGGRTSGPETGHQEVGPSNWSEVGLLITHSTESTTRASVLIADNAVPLKGGSLLHCPELAEG